MTDGLMADGLVDAEKRKASGIMTGILEAGSTGARTLPMASKKVLPEMLITSWLLAASETRRHRLDFCQLRLLGHLCSTPVAERLGWPQWLQVLRAADRL